MSLGTQLYYRAEQFVLWQRHVSVQELADEFSISHITAMRILLQLEHDGVVSETEEEGEFRALKSKPLNANEANREMHQLLSAATRCMRDAGIVDVETFAEALGLTQKKAQEILQLMQELGITKKAQMYRALSRLEVEELDKSWYDPYESSVQLVDPAGLNKIIYHEYDDPLYPEVVRFVIEVQKASAALLQRYFHIGYARAARLMDIMEEEGVIGSSDGANPREVLKQLPPDFDMGLDENEEVDNKKDQAT